MRPERLRFSWFDGLGRFRPNPRGLYDAHGNVLEMCCNGPHRYGEQPQKRPQESGFAVARGGCNRYGVLDARCAWRQNGSTGNRAPCVGLWPARDIDGN